MLTTWLIFIIHILSSSGMQDIFVNQLRILVSKKKLVEVTVTEGWYSEEELSSDFNWKK